MKAGKKDVTGAFSRRTNGRFEGLVSSLPIGKTTLTATAPNARKGHLKIVDHPNGGPDFSGPQVQPWVCQATAVDKQCNQPPTYTFSYQNTDGRFQSIRPRQPALRRREDDHRQRQDGAVHHPHRDRLSGP